MLKKLLLFTFILATSSTQAQSLWQDVAENQVQRSTSQTRWIIPTKYRTVRLNETMLKQWMLSIPKESSDLSFSAKQSTFTVALPMPNGGTNLFRVAETAVLHPELAKKFPEIKTFEAYGITEPTAYARFDYTPQGFHGLIFTDKGMVYIDPYQQNDTQNYISYYKHEFRSNKTMSCQVVDEDNQAAEIERLVQNLRRNNERPSGATLLTYRAAVATTGEYTTFHGGTVSGALAAIATTMNRVSGVYQVELSIRMQVIANNNLIIYTDAGTDPYTNNSGSAMLGENQTNVDNLIGNANYDIGHVFSTGGGGIAGLGVVCRTGQKGRGVTGSGSPVNDPFDIDYVAHEMGHQFAGNHTFNGNQGSCGGNRSGSTAYEPGSGVTIMAYAGICGSDNLASNSIAIFHVGSYDEIFAYTRNGSGNGCPVVTTNGSNQPPVPTVPTGGFVIPIGTPFQLTGSATDPNSDALTYCWEEFDLGAAGSPSSPAGNAPIFRSFLPTSSPSRTFPKIQDIVNNTTTLGELLPSYTRNLTFRMSVRDNLGGYDYAQVAFTANSAAGPFVVNYPNSAVTWRQGSTQLVSWSVANTNLSPVNCQTVNIKLSTDGGLTYPTTLATGVPNNGFAEITVPVVTTTQARIRVEAADNIFFDISNINFTINNVAAGGAPLVNTFSPPDNASDISVSSNLKIYFNQDVLKGTGNILLKRYATDAVVETFDVTGSRVTVSGNVATIDPTSNLELGVTYYVEIPNTALRNGSSQFYGGTTNKDTWNFSSSDNISPTINSFSPADNATDVAFDTKLTITFSEPISKGSAGSITIKRMSNNSLKQSIGINSSTVAVSNNVAEITIAALEFDTEYYVEMPSGTFKDFANNNFAGISGNSTWNFKTQTTATSLMDLKEGKLQLYPNPAKDVLQIKLENSPQNIKKVQLYTVLGQKLNSFTMDDTQYILKMQDLANGVYIVEVTVGEQVIRQRIVKK